MGIRWQQSSRRLITRLDEKKDFKLVNPGRSFFSRLGNNAESCWINPRNQNNPLEYLKETNNNDVVSERKSTNSSDGYRPKYVSEQKGQ